MNNFDLGLIFTSAASPWATFCCQQVPAALLFKTRAHRTDKLPSALSWGSTKVTNTIPQNIPVPSPNLPAYEHNLIAVFAPMVNAHIASLPGAMKKASVLMTYAHWVSITFSSCGTSLTHKYFQKLAKLQWTVHRRQLLHLSEAEVKNTEPEPSRFKLYKNKYMPRPSKNPCLQVKLHWRFCSCGYGTIKNYFWSILV